MSHGLPKYAAKPDANKAEIIKALERLSITVEEIDFPVDLLIWVPFRMETLLMEVKNPDGKNTLSKAQVEFIARWPGPVHVVRSAEEAIRCAVGEEHFR